MFNYALASLKSIVFTLTRSFEISEPEGRVTDLIRRIAKDRTVLMVEHNLNVVSDLCDRVTVLARGEILAEGTYDEVSRNRQVREAYMGSEHE